MNMVRITRHIIACGMSIAMLVAFSSATTLAGPVCLSARSDCCKKHSDSSSPKSQDRDGTSCVMQCCRIISAPAASIPRTVGEVRALPDRSFTPLVLHSLTVAEAVFHPPRS